MFIERIFQPPKNESYFLFGPRGTGKTTWLKNTYLQETLWIDLLNASEERRFAARPELLKEQLDINENKKWVIIDEIQKVPKLLDIVHLLIEEKKERQFVLTGSSARKLRRGGVNLLGGRALWKKPSQVSGAAPPRTGRSPHPVGRAVFTRASPRLLCASA